MLLRNLSRMEMGLPAGVNHKVGMYLYIHLFGVFPRVEYCHESRNCTRQTFCHLILIYSAFYLNGSFSKSRFNSSVFVYLIENP